jgi:hypothetical protein
VPVVQQAPRGYKPKCDDVAGPCRRTEDSFLYRSGWPYGLAGCVGPTLVVMKNLATGEIVQCKGANTGLWMPAESMAARDCANGYTAAAVTADLS